MTELSSGAPPREAVEVTFQTGYLELRRVVAAINAQLAWPRWIRRAAGATVLLGVVGGVLGPLRSAAPTLVVGGAAVLLWYWVMTWLTAWLLLQKGSLLAARNTLTFTPDGLSGTAAAASGRSPWQVYTRAAETREFLLLFQGAQCAVFVPWRALTPEDAARLRLMVRRCVGQPGAAAYAEAPPLPPPGAVLARFPLRQRDVFRCVMVLSWRTRAGWRATAVLLVVVVPCLWMLRDLFTRGTPGEVLLGLLPLAILLGATPFGAWWGARRYVRSMPRGTELTVFATDEGITSWTPRGSTAVGWQSVPRRLRTRSLLIFSLGGMQGIYIPRDALDPASQRRLLDLGTGQ